MTDSIAVLIKAYCLFSFVCFTPVEITGDGHRCPERCRCFEASAEESATSLVCTDVRFVPPMPAIINTLVFDVRKSQFSFRSTIYQQQQQKFRIQSLVLQGFTGTFDVDDHENGGHLLPSIFDLIDGDSLDNLQILEWTHRASPYQHVWFDFSMIDRFDRLSVLRMARCHRSAIDYRFRSARMPSLHTLIITDSQLEYIDQTAFGGKAPQLRKLVLAGNQLIGGLDWITQCPDTFDRLWHLDVSHNQLRYLPENLVEKLPALSVLLVEGNNFRWFRWQTIEPLIGQLSEFRLAETESNQPAPVLYLNQQMKWLADAEVRSAIRGPMYIGDSLVNGYRYFSNVGLQTLGQLLAGGMSDVSWIAYQPDQLTLNTQGGQGRLEVIHCDANTEPQMLDPVMVAGLDLITPSDDYFSVPFMEKRAGLAALYPRATSQRRKKIVVRAPLFHPSFHQYLNGMDKFDGEAVSAMIKLAAEFLDRLYVRQLYAIFVLWPADFIPDLAIIEPEMAKFKEFKERILGPLAAAINDHPALVGFEITDQAFPQLRSSQQETLPDAESQGCPYPKGLLEIVHRNLYFLKMNIEMIRETFGRERLIGIGFEANCRPCLPLLLIQPCLPETVDFLTIRSLFSSGQVSNQYYHHSKIGRELDQWYNQDHRINKLRGKNLFYSFYNLEQHIDQLDGETERLMAEHTMGYFTPFHLVINSDSHRWPNSSQPEPVR